jgi:phosphoglycerate kinase
MQTKEKQLTGNVITCMFVPRLRAGCGLALKTMDQLSLDGARVFLRLDLNVKLDAEGSIEDDQRILAALPTLQELLEREARLVVAAHLGRPQGKRDPALSIEPVAARLAHLLDVEVLLSEDSVGDGPRKMAFALREGQLMMLENLRFYPGETENDDGFCRQLALLADVYVNDAFASVHRNHASVAGVPSQVKHRGMGRQCAREVENLGKVLRKPARPFVAVVGGSRVREKVDLLLNLVGLADVVCVGGAAALPFLAAKGVRLGAFRPEPDAVAAADKVLRKASKCNTALVFPMDHVVAAAAECTCERQVAENSNVPSGQLPLDIGPRTLERFREIAERGQTVLWNGPLGACELEPFAEGTRQLGRAIGRSSSFSVVVGTDTVTAVRRAGLTPFFSHVSHGAAAALKYLEGAVLPGLAALEEE